MGDGYDGAADRGDEYQDIFSDAAKARATRSAVQPATATLAPADGDIFSDAAKARAARPATQTAQSPTLAAPLGQPAPAEPSAPSTEKPAATISAYQPSWWERMKSALGAKAPQGSRMAQWTQELGTTGEPQLITPEAAMTPKEREAHPEIAGLGEVAGSLTTPTNVALLAGTAGLGGLAGTAGRLAPRLVSGVFTAQMLKGAYDQFPEFRDALDRGDESEARRILTHLVATGALSYLGARHAAGLEPLPTLPPGLAETPGYLGDLSRAEQQARTTERLTGRPLAAQLEGPRPTEPVVQGEAMRDRIARRMQAVDANQAARAGMERLTEAERGIEAARQARVAAPVELPRVRPSEEPIPIAGPEPRTPMEQLSAEAAEVTREREAREAGQRYASSLKDEIADQIIKRLRDEGVFEEGQPGDLRVTDRLAGLREESLADRLRRRGETIAQASETARPGMERLARTEREIFNPPGVQESAAQDDIFSDVAAKRAARETPLFGRRPEALPVEIPDYVREQSDAALRKYAKLAGNPTLTAQAQAELVRRAAEPREARPERAPREEAPPQRVSVAQEQPAAPKPEDVTNYGRNQAQLYVNRVRSARRGAAGEFRGAYAQDLLTAMLHGTPEPEPAATMTMQQARAIRSNVIDFLARQGPEKVSSRFDPDVLEEAHRELASAADFAGAQERPGRYAADVEGEKELQWYGVNSARRMIRDQWPWYSDEMTPQQLVRAAERGKGADYERIMGAIADHVVAERDSARPVLEEYAPEMRALAEAVEHTDPELASNLRDLAEGRFRPRNLKEYIANAIADAHAAAHFSDALDEARAEPAGPAGTEEIPGFAAEPRAEGGEAGGIEREPLLPGTEEAVAEHHRGAAEEQARRLTDEVRTTQDINLAAGEMERGSPLFRGTEASPQHEMFAPGGGDIFDEAARATAKKGGTTLYTFPAALFDAEAWRTAFPGATEALARFGKLELSPGDVMRGILREQTGELARSKEQLYHALTARAQEWDARPEKERLDFIMREQHGQPQETKADQSIADQLRAMFADRRRQIEQLGHGAFSNWRKNYFPQMWERPERVRDWINEVLTSKRPIEGPASFKKGRVFEDIQEGIDAGFKPLTTNPITLALAKITEMDRYILAHTTLDAMKQSGIAKAVMVGTDAPEGWTRLDDRIGTIYGRPEIPVKEAYDRAVWDQLAKVADNLGIEHTRAVGIGGKRLGYATPGQITTRFATPESVIAHEIGHNLDWKYGLKEQLVKNPLYAKELRALADLHVEGMRPEDVPESFRRYIRQGSEKMATMVEALVHAPEKFRQVAPNTWDFLQRFIADRPELKPLLEAKPSLRYDTRTSEVSAGGMVIHGFYYAPREAANVFNSYLSPGLQRFKSYNAVRMVGNTLNQAQLGLSAFHLGFTSLDSSVSDMALALERLSRGDVARAVVPAARSLTLVGSPIKTLLTGNHLLREYLEPGRFAQMARLADAVAQAGGRVRMDPYYKNQAIESFWKAWGEGNYARAGLRAFPAAMEWAAKPVMEYAVPRMKLGVFANIAEDVLTRADREQWDPVRTRYELNRAWDSVDNRMGQIVYDNLFWNRAVKDLGMVSVRSLGWNLGTAREIFGGGLDLARQGARLATGERAELTHRMAYVMALPIVVGFTGAVIHYLSTGRQPQTLTDYFFPQTGKVGPNGRPERLSLPSYLKDLYELREHPMRTALNKIHPAITATAQFLRNEDYFGTEIHHAGDPFIRQRLDDAEFVAKQFLPFSIRNAYQRAEAAGQTGLAAPLRGRSLAGTAESMIGLVPAPRSITGTHAEELAHDLALRTMPEGPRTRDQFDASQRLRSYENRLRSGEMLAPALRSEVAAGHLTGRQAETAIRSARISPLARDFQHLSLADALSVWDAADEQERRELRPILAGKGRQLEHMPAADRRRMQEQLSAALEGTPATRNLAPPIWTPAAARPALAPPIQ